MENENPPFPGFLPLACHSYFTSAPFVAPEFIRLLGIGYWNQLILTPHGRQLLKRAGTVLVALFLFNFYPTHFINYLRITWATTPPSSDDPEAAAVDNTTRGRIFFCEFEMSRRTFQILFWTVNAVQAVLYGLLIFFWSRHVRDLSILDMQILEDGQTGVHQLGVIFTIMGSALVNLFALMGVHLRRIEASSAHTRGPLADKV